MADDAVYEDVGAGALFRGRDAIVRYYVGSSPHSTESRTLILSEQQSEISSPLNGRWQGPTMASSDHSLPPTKRYELRGVTVGELADRRFTSKRDYYNLADLLSQLGVPPS